MTKISLKNNNIVKQENKKQQILIKKKNQLSILPLLQQQTKYQ